jgi:hypothetical protein
MISKSAVCTLLAARVDGPLNDVFEVALMALRAMIFATEDGICEVDANLAQVSVAG